MSSTTTLLMRRCFAQLCCSKLQLPPQQCHHHPVPNKTLLAAPYRPLPTACNYVSMSTTNHYQVDIPTSEEDDYMRWRREGVLSIDEIVDNINELKGQDLIVINLDEHVNYVKYFVIATANSYRHLRAMAQSMNQLYKRRKRQEDPFTIIEGKKESRDWQCIELGNSVVHFMTEESRERYQLEKLWLLGHQYDDLLRQEPSQQDIVHQLTTGGLKMMSSAEDDDVIYLSENDIIDFPSWDDVGDPVKADKSNDLDDDDIIDEDDYVV